MVSNLSVRKPPLSCPRNIHADTAAPWMWMMIYCDPVSHGPTEFFVSGNRNNNILISGVYWLKSRPWSLRSLRYLKALYIHMEVDRKCGNNCWRPYGQQQNKEHTCIIHLTIIIITRFMKMGLTIRTTTWLIIDNNNNIVYIITKI